MFTKYDFYSKQELKKEIKQRNLRVPMNASGLKFRMALEKDDREKGIDPTLKIEFSNPQIEASKR